MRIMSARERAKKTRVTGAIFGPHGVGKTSLIRTLDPETTLFLDLEAGSKAVEDWPGDSIRITSWKEARDIACLASGPDNSLAQFSNGDWPLYSGAHYDHLKEANGGLLEALNRYSVHFWDSVSVASRMCWDWAVGQEGSFSEKTGKADTRGTYRIVGQELVRWLTRIQHSEQSVWVVGGLDRVTDDFNRITWSPQIEGSKAAREMLGIFDQIISMVTFPKEDGSLFRAFVCRQDNRWKYPAKDRSGRLEEIESPNLGHLMVKLNGPRADRFSYEIAAEDNFTE